MGKTGLEAFGLAVLIILTIIGVSWFGSGDRSPDACSESPNALCPPLVHTVLMGHSMATQMYDRMGFDPEYHLAYEGEADICYDLAHWQGGEPYLTMGIAMLLGFVLALVELLVLLDVEMFAASRIMFGTKRGIVQTQIDWGTKIADAFSYPYDKIGSISSWDQMTSKNIVFQEAKKNADAVRQKLKKVKGAYIPGFTPTKSEIKTTQKDESSAQKEYAKAMRKYAKTMRPAIAQMRKKVKAGELGEEWADLPPSMISMAQQAIYEGMMLPSIIDHASMMGLIFTLFMAAFVAVLSLVIHGWGTFWDVCLENLFIKPFLILAAGYWLYLLFRNLIVHGANAFTTLVPNFLTSLIFFFFEPSTGTRNPGAGAMQSFMKVLFVLFVFSSSVAVVDQSSSMLFALQASLAVFVILEMLAFIGMSMVAFGATRTIIDSGEEIGGTIGVVIKVFSTIKETMTSIGDTILSVQQAWLTMFTTGSLSGFGDVKTSIVNGFEGVKKGMNKVAGKIGDRRELRALEKEQKKRAEEQQKIAMAKAQGNYDLAAALQGKMDQGRKTQGSVERAAKKFEEFEDKMESWGQSLAERNAQMEYDAQHPKRQFGPPPTVKPLPSQSPFRQAQAAIAKKMDSEVGKFDDPNKFGKGQIDQAAQHPRRQLMDELKQKLKMMFGEGGVE